MERMWKIIDFMWGTDDLDPEKQMMKRRDLGLAALMTLIFPIGFALVLLLATGNL